MDITLNGVIGELEDADPTTNKQYVQWLIKMFVNGALLEDLISRGGDNLEKFEILKKKRLIKPEHADIGKFKLLADLEEAMEDYEIPEEENVDKGQYEVIIDNDQFRALVPFDKKAACYYGQGTRWCTAAKNHNMFFEYDRKGDLVIIIPKKPNYKGEKYQVHHKPFVIMDEKDKEMVWSRLAGRFSSLNSPDDLFYNKKTIKARIEKDLMPVEKAWKYADSYKGEAPKEIEGELAKDPYFAYTYAALKLKGRFPEGEAAIAKSYEYAYLYARDVIGGRFPEGEKTIMTNLKHTFLYARDIIKGPWPEAEAFINRSEHTSQIYHDFLDDLKRNK